MINKEQAEEIAKREIKETERKSNSKLALLEDETIEFEFGWVFFYQSEEFVKSGNLLSLVGGNAPILVDKQNGSTILTGTSKDVNFYIQIYSKFKKDWLS